MRSYSGRSCALTPEQLLALKAAYELHTANAPLRLAQRFGVSKNTVYAYVRGRHKIGPVRRAAANTNTEK